MNIFHIIELILILLVIIWQVIIFINTKKNIDFLKNIFGDIKSLSLRTLRITPYQAKHLSGKEIEAELSSKGAYNGVIDLSPKYDIDEFIEDEDKPIDIAVIRFNSSDASEILQNILNATNVYLVRNKNHAADFKILKEIVDNNSEAQEHQIESTLSLPLYIGLLGTIIGIIIGLFQMSSFDVEDSSVIQEMMLGISFAMGASFMGLLLTVIHSGFNYKRALKVNNDNKNLFFTFLQTELLPILAVDSQSNLNTLQDNINAFNNTFKLNLKDFDKTIRAIENNFKMQTDLVNSLKNMEFNRLLAHNIEVFQEIRKSTEQFKLFVKHQEVLNSNVSKLTTAITYLELFIGRIQHFESNTVNVAKYIEEKVDGFETVTAFYKNNLIQIQNREEAMTDNLANLDESLSESFKMIYTETNNHIIELSDKVQKALDALSEQIDAKIKAIDEVTTQEVNNLQKAFEDNRTQLGNLKYLKSMDDRINRLANILEKKNKEVRKDDGTLQELQKLNEVMNRLADKKTPLEIVGKKLGKVWNYLFKSPKNRK